MIINTNFNIRLCGFPPFFSYDDYTDVNMLLNAPFWYFFNEETESLTNQIKLGHVTFPEPFWKDISEDGTRILRTFPFTEIHYLPFSYVFQPKTLCLRC